MARGYWLVKSDPDTFGWPELLAEPDRTTCWDGVRNYQARNFLRDDVKKGDRVLFYHSQSDRAVVGTATVVRAAYPDPTQFEPGAGGHDPRAEPGEPIWYAVDIRADREFAAPVALDAMRSEPSLADMPLLKRGNRLSVFPVSGEHFRTVCRMGRRRR